jgi:hypothetical protein
MSPQDPPTNPPDFRARGEVFRESPRLQAELLAHAVGIETRVLDFVARLAAAWNGEGELLLRTSERRALCEIGGLERVSRFDDTRWEFLDGEERRCILFGARRAIELGRACGWIFGQGSGPKV